jgi:hypothetical protein
VPRPEAATAVDLAALAARGALRAVGRAVGPLDSAGVPGLRGVRVDERAGAGVVWLEGVEFAEGTIDLMVRGRDVLQRSFLGVAFHAADDSTYDAVYLRPFNFRAADPVRRQHAVQYISAPTHDFDRLRRERPEEFENPVEPAPEPGAWVRLRVEVRGPQVRVYVGEGAAPDLTVEKLNGRTRGGVGLWVGNNSPGDFADVRVIPAR